jgi:hypothetical protein
MTDLRYLNQLTGFLKGLGEKMRTRVSAGSAKILEESKQL